MDKTPQQKRELKQNLLTELGKLKQKKLDLEVDTTIYSLSRLYDGFKSNIRFESGQVNKEIEELESSIIALRKKIEELSKIGYINYEETLEKDRHRRMVE